LIVRENLGENAIVGGSTADKAGLKEYDIILELDGKKISEENPLADILQECEIGKEVNLKILREKKEIKLKAKLEERK